jgi:hypothetical protein
MTASMTGSYARGVGVAAGTEHRVHSCRGTPFGNVARDPGADCTVSSVAVHSVL